MEAPLKSLAQRCLQAAKADTMTFPEIVRALSDGGFESYIVDYRRSTAVYFTADGDSIILEGPSAGEAVAPRLDVEALGEAIREAQTLAPGYTYLGFCAKAKQAGCAGYMVSFTGRRALYFGRDGVTHVEHFPA